jgi:hypothetical protein
VKHCTVLFLAAACASAADVSFREHTIATDLRGGYQVVPYDVNRDGRVDLIALASGMAELVWFENPAWERHTLAAGMSRMINVAACAGVDEMVVAQAFENEPARSLGIVSVLTPGADREQPWAVREIDRLTTSHRLRCADIDGSGRTVIINAPLAGAKAKAPDYRDHIPLVYYRPGEWKRVTIGEENEGVMHGIFIAPWRTVAPAGKRDCVLTASFLGIHAYCLEGGGAGMWRRREISKANSAEWPKSGASDIALGRLERRPFLASIEPWHGNQVAIYRDLKGTWSRQVIDDTLVDGHTILAADFDGDRREEVVAGYRGKGRSVYLYRAQDAAGAQWKRSALDDGGMAAAACAGVDLNRDGKLDVACIGQATTNLKWYENVGK